MSRHNSPKRRQSKPKQWIDDWPLVERCPACGKLRYLSRAAAKKVAKRLPPTDGVRMGAYACGDYWHVGHVPTAVRRGETSRTEYGR